MSLSRNTSTPNAFDKINAFELYKGLFPKDIQNALTDKTELRFVSSRVLNDVPLAALVSENPRGKTRWLADEFSLSVAPAFGTRSKAKKNRVKANIRMVGLSGDFDLAQVAGSNFKAYRSFAGSQTLKDLPALPETKEEIISIARALNPKSVSLLSGDESTEEGFRATDLAEVDIFAFATHGLMSGEIEGLDEPALVLNVADNTDDASRDGLLTASEISKLDLNADWVILSACNTASSNGYNSGSYAGLTRAFLYAGADALLVSHWPVRDDAAAFLTVNTVKNTQAGMSKAKALQLAMRDLRESSDIPHADHPAIWAPFVLVD